MCDEDPWWSSEEQNPQVSPEGTSNYTVIVIDKYGCIASDSITVTVIKGKIIIEKVVINEDSDDEFIINVEGPNGKKWNIFIAEGRPFEIGNLTSGSYRINEIVPMDYKLVSISSSTVNIDRNNRTVKVTVRNQKSHTGWFKDVDERDNFITVGLSGGEPMIGPMSVSFDAESSHQNSVKFLFQEIFEVMLPEDKRASKKVVSG
jgi:hypothetical protein